MSWTAQPHASPFADSPFGKALRLELLVVLVGALALATNVGTELVKSAPPALDLADDAGLAALAVLAFVVARQRRQMTELLARERAARADAERAIRIRDECLASVSHDLRGPLATISGYAQLARRRAGVPEVETAVSNIEIVAQRMARALDELLEVALVQAGQRPRLRRGLTDIVELVERAVAYQEVAARGCAFHILSSVESLIGNWDAARLERVLTNLLDNAAKYSPTGGDVTVIITREGETAVLSVHDQGIGIPRDELERVFEPFQRATNTGAIAGNGLGLAAAREIIDQHGGTIGVTATEGRGSTFTIRLPIESSAQVVRNLVDSPQRTP